MYKIIGTDQKEYGPVTSDKINQWIIQGRVNAQTKVQSEGCEWKPLGDFPEFASSFGSQPSAAPSPLSPPPPQPVEQTSGLAIASLVLGILGFFSCGLCGIVGLILGIKASKQIKNSNGAVGGQGLATAGTVVSSVTLLLLLLAPFIFAAMFLPALAVAKQKALTIQCVNNVRQLALGVKIYSGDHNDHFPPAATWCDAIKNVAISDRVFKCPAANSNERCDYAYNAKLDGLAQKDIDPSTVLLFETEGGWNENGGSELMLVTARHRVRGQSGFVVAFADGHVEQVSRDQLANLRWNP